jgi:hypothetical protein
MREDIVATGIFIAVIAVCLSVVALQSCDTDHTLKHCGPDTRLAVDSVEDTGTGPYMLQVYVCPEHCYWRTTYTTHNKQEALDICKGG